MGPQGLQGLPGADGADGAQGPAGPQGPAGASPFTLDGSDAVYNAGSVGIGTGSATLSALLQVEGEARVDVLTIMGGADIVERFEAADSPEPGTVVVIDAERPGALKTSTEPYDLRVAGVVSGAGDVNPGICLSQDGVLDGDTLVAMTGRVFVRCSAENGPIRPGDRLTTAALAGHAMRATDKERTDGAVIGKAMGALDEGTGLVLVLVNLQ